MPNLAQLRQLSYAGHKYYYSDCLFLLEVLENKHSEIYKIEALAFMQNWDSVGFEFGQFGLSQIQSLSLTYILKEEDVSQGEEAPPTSTNQSTK